MRSDGHHVKFYSALICIKMCTYSFEIHTDQVHAILYAGRTVPIPYPNIKHWPVWVAQTRYFFKIIGFMIQRPTFLSLYSKGFFNNGPILIQFGGKWKALSLAHVLPFFRNGTEMHAISRREIMIWWNADAVVSSKRGGTPFCIYLEREREKRDGEGEIQRVLNIGFD